MEPECSLPCSQQPTTSFYPECHESILHPPTYFFKIHFNTVLPLTPKSSKWSLLFRVADLNCVRVPHLPKSSTFSPHLIHLDLIILMKGLCVEHFYELWSSSSCNFFQSRVASSLLDRNLLFSTMFSNILDLCPSINVRNQFSHPYKATGTV
jgi:hypothetical protein